MKKTLPLLVILVLAAALGWALFVWEPGQGGHADMGVAGRPAGGDFTLQSANGPVSLADFRGKVVLLYFGYTSCPDICPTSLALMQGALHRLEPAELERVQGLFVSVDPQRDTPQRLAEYTAYFHPAITGVTGTPEAVAEAAGQYGAVYRRVESDSDMGYLVDHSSATYVIDPAGELHAVLPHGTPPAEIVAAVRGLL